MYTCIKPFKVMMNIKCKVFIQSTISNSWIHLYDLKHMINSANELKQKTLYSVIVINSHWNLKQQNVLQVHVSPKKKKWKLTIEHPPPQKKKPHTNHKKHC